MGVNLEGRSQRQRYQQQVVSAAARSPDTGAEQRAVHIHTLGRFTVQVDGRSVSVGRSRQHRPIELLQALIAFGGRDVGVELLSQALWPDADGDLAKNAFDVTLYRLRRALAVKDLLRLSDHRLTLNGDLAWVDAWTFERLVNHAERLLGNAADDPLALRQLARIGERILSLYQGNFLDREAGKAWSLTLRERLRSKLLRHILDTGRVWERMQEWEPAIRLYRKGLEIDPLAEILYQRLILCLRDNGQPGDALAVFHRCREVLDQHFEVGPSPATAALYSSLKS